MQHTSTERAAKTAKPFGQKSDTTRPETTPSDIFVKRYNDTTQRAENTISPKIVNEKEEKAKLNGTSAVSV